MFMTQIIMLLCEIYQVVKILAPATSFFCKAYEYKLPIPVSS